MLKHDCLVFKGWIDMVIGNYRRLNHSSSLSAARPFFHASPARTGASDSNLFVFIQVVWNIVCLYFQMYCNHSLLSDQAVNKIQSAVILADHFLTMTALCWRGRENLYILLDSPCLSICPLCLICHL